MVDSKPTESSKMSYDVDSQKKLWELSIEFTDAANRLAALNAEPAAVEV